MPKVGIIMGSDSDLKVMSKAAVMLEELGIEYEMTIISAHREPDELIEWTRGAESRGISGWNGCSVLNHADAAGGSGCNRCDRRSKECSNSCSKDSCNFR